MGDFFIKLIELKKEYQEEMDIYMKSTYDMAKKLNKDVGRIEYMTEEQLQTFINYGTFLNDIPKENMEDVINELLEILFDYNKYLSQWRIEIEKYYDKLEKGQRKIEYRKIQKANIKKAEKFLETIYNPFWDNYVPYPTPKDYNEVVENYITIYPIYSMKHPSKLQTKPLTFEELPIDVILVYLTKMYINGGVENQRLSAIGKHIPNPNLQEPIKKEITAYLNKVSKKYNLKASNKILLIQKHLNRNF